MAALISILVIGVVAVTAISYFVTIYNGLIDLDKSTDRAWSNIDVLLKQRHDELPNLVSAVESYMAHERDTLERVIEARSRMTSARGVAATAEASGELSGALRQLFALAEGYPELKADASFQQLQTRISQIEEQIADRREFYNHAVNRFNVRIRQIPDVFVAGMLRLTTDKEYFRVAEQERATPRLQFSNFPGANRPSA